MASAPPFLRSCRLSRSFAVGLLACKSGLLPVLPWCGCSIAATWLRGLLLRETAVAAVLVAGAFAGAIAGRVSSERSARALCVCSVLRAVERVLGAHTYACAGAPVCSVRVCTRALFIITPVPRSISLGSGQ